MNSRTPYGQTNVAPERTMMAINKLLYSSRCTGIQWTEVGDMIELRFVLMVEGRPLTIRLRPAMLTQTKRSQGRRGATVTMVNKSATMRLLFYYLKSQVEAVQSGLIDVREAFLAHVVGRMADGSEATVYELIGPRLGNLVGSDLIRALPAPRGEEQ